MGLFGNALATLVDSTRNSALSLFDEAQRVFDDFDLDATVDSLLDRGSSLCDTLAEFGRTIKDSVSDFKVVIPFNEKREKFEYNVTGNVLKVTVDGKNSHRETSATIPDNCIVDDMRHVINKKTGELVIIIPKDIAKDENLKKIKEDTINRVRQTAEQIVNTVKEKTEALAEKKETPKKKVGRDKKGRFTSKVESVQIQVEAPKAPKKPLKKKKVKKTQAKEQA